MLEEYDPMQAPDPDEWLAMDEDDDEFEAPNEAYYRELERLTPESWRREFGEDG